MIQTLEALRDAVKGQGRKTLAVAAAGDTEVLLAVDNARKMGIASAILVGDEEKIRTIAAQQGIPLEEYRLIPEPDPAQACRRAVKLVRDGEADVVMKGLVDTSVILKAVLDREIGLRKGPVLSHVALFQVAGYDRLFVVTDVAMNIAPNLETKKDIIRNAVGVAHALGNENPIVACLCAVEKLNPKMPATIEASALVEAWEAGELPGCRVVGPLALDNAVSPEAARHKGITNPLAGHGDVLLAPNIETGNVLYKALVFLARAKNAGVIVGAKAPVVLTSRADSDEAKLNSIALALMISSKS